VDEVVDISMAFRTGWHGSLDCNYISPRYQCVCYSRTYQAFNQSLAHFHHTLASHLPCTAAHRALKRLLVRLIRVCQIGTNQQGQMGGITPSQVALASLAGGRRRVGGGTTILI